MENPLPKALPAFTPYQKFIIALLAFVQFTVVFDFVVLSPLSAILLKELDITTAQFGLVVSAYAFSAGASGILAAGYADRFDRKNMLMFFYVGFVIGTLLCGIAPSYHFLLGARIITGIFGGVISSISMAIVTDLFPLEKRGRVMGFVQMAFAASQVLGIPFGLYLATQVDWHAPFLLIVLISIVVGIITFFKLQPINEHLLLHGERNAFLHLARTASNRRYMKGFAAISLLATGGFMLMPFGAAYTVNNLGISLDVLPMVYMITGIFSMISGPLIGRLSDKIGKFKAFWMGSVLTIITLLIYCNLGITPLWMVISLSVVMFVGITARIISAQALMTAVPEPRDRGAFMGINSSIQQISGGIASAVAGLIVYQSETGQLQNYPILGWVVTGSVLITVAMMYMIDNLVNQKLPESTVVPEAA